MTFEGYDWLPTLNDVEYWKSQGTTEERTYYGNYGWEKLVVPTDATHVSAKMTDLKTLFVERYGFRRLNAETMPRWQIYLQRTFDKWVEDMERAYSLYETNGSAMLSDFKRGTTQVNSGTDSQTTGNTRTNSGTDTTTTSGTTKNVDTPDSAVNASDDYADSVTKNSGSSSTSHGHIVADQGSRSMIHGHQIKTSIDGETVERVNNVIDKWKDIDILFIGKFEDNFLNVFDY